MSLLAFTVIGGDPFTLVVDVLLFILVVVVIVWAIKRFL